MGYFSDWLSGATKFAGGVLGTTGKAIDTLGTNLNNPLGEGWGVSENLERLGGMLNPPKAYASEVTDFSNLQTPNTSVLGQNTSTNPTRNTPTNTGGNFDSVYNAYYQGWDKNAAYQDFLANPNKFGSGGGSSGPSYEDQIRSAIESGYGNYFSQLDSMLGDLGNQRSNKEQIVENSYNQNISDLSAQTADSNALLNTQRRKAAEGQNKSLKDLSSNLRNQYLAGNVYLGSRGAGDSSAADMYSYALTKLGSKQRGDITAQTGSILNDIADREAKVKNIETQEKARLGTERTNQMLSVASEFDAAQQQIKQMKASGELQKGQDLASLSTQLLNNAMQKLARIDDDYRSRVTALTEWAVGNSKNLAELKTNLSGISNVAYSLPQAQQVLGTPSVDASGNYVAPVGFGYGQTEKKDIFGNRIA